MIKKLRYALTKLPITTCGELTEEFYYRVWDHYDDETLAIFGIERYEEEKKS